MSHPDLFINPNILNPEDGQESITVFNLYKGCLSFSKSSLLSLDGKLGVYSKFTINNEPNEPYFISSIIPKIAFSLAHYYVISNQIFNLSEYKFLVKHAEQICITNVKITKDDNSEVPVEDLFFLSPKLEDISQ